MTDSRSPHTVDTLNERVNAIRDLIDERDRRYTEQGVARAEAVRLAKVAADSAQGKVGIAVVLGTISTVIGIVAMIVSMVVALGGGGGK